jgi:hypothetical protein
MLNRLAMSSFIIGSCLIFCEKCLLIRIAEIA